MKQKDGPLTIGPLVLKPNTPYNIYNSLLTNLYEQVKRINKKYTTQLNFDNGRFNRHLRAIQDVMDWLDKYQVLMLVSLNCAHNSLPTLRSLTTFYLPNLQTLDFCQIQSIELLTECFFPNLLTLVLYNNHIISIKPLRKCYFPFLSELIIDSNYITDIYPLYRILCPHIQRLEINNNLIVDLRPILKANFSSLSELRMENIEVENFMDQGYEEDGSPKLIRRKFVNL